MGLMQPQESLQEGDRRVRVREDVTKEGGIRGMWGLEPRNVAASLS